MACAVATGETWQLPGLCLLVDARPVPINGFELLRFTIELKYLLLTMLFTGLARSQDYQYK